MLHDLKERKAVATAEARSLIETAHNARRPMNPEEVGRFDALKAEITRLDQEESRTVFLEEAERRMAGAPVSGDKPYRDLENSVSLRKVIQAGIEGRALDGAEAEYSKEAERRTGRKAEGAFVPLSLLERRVNTTTSAANIVPTDHRPDQYIDALRNKLLARSLGVRVLSGLHGDVSIPAHGTSVASGWVAENGPLTPSDMTFGTKLLSPNHVGVLSETTRQLIQQSSPEIEQLMRDDMAFSLAQAIDSALIKGGGTNQTKGVLSTTGIQTASLATLGWDGILAMIEKAELENAAVSSWLTSPGVMKKLRGTLKSPSAGAAYLCENGRMADLPVHSTNQVPLATDKGQLILGDWSQVLFGIWSELDILVNPYESTAYARGGVLVRAMATCDIAVRHPKAFVVASDIVLSEEPEEE